MGKNVFVLGALLLFGAFILSGCITDDQNGDDSNAAVEFRDMPRFKNYHELKAAFSAGGSRQYGIYDMVGGMNGIMAQKSFTAQTSMAESDSGANSGSSNYSQTNVQVEGVDEADIIKTDGKYVYTFSQNKLIIIDAYPLEDGKILSQTELEGMQPIEMFVNGDKLILFANIMNGYYYGYGGMPLREATIDYDDTTMPEYEPYTLSMQVYDISERDDPQLEKEVEFTGNYVTSRMVNGEVVFVVNSYPRYYPIPAECSRPETLCELVAGEQNIIPLMKEDGVEKTVAQPSSIGYLPPVPAQSFVTIASLDLSDMTIEKETIAGSAENVYASSENIYIASTAWLPPENQILKDTPGKEIERIIVGDTQKTIINKFNFSTGEIGFLGQGAVPGHILNQFSMDEFEGNFRIATTVGEVWQTGSNSKNNLYVLDEDMATIGKLENLAPGEKIYSARFMGKKAYMVTFKKVDPLFVIDVEDPTNPKVLGKLKIPGYSDYLHPIDETHLIGIGKDTIESGYGDFAWYQGMKMAIFDVSDVEHPVEMHKIIIGDRGTDSYALHDHKAFLFDAEKNLLVLPIELHLIPEDLKEENTQEDPDTLSRRSFPQYGEAVFQGAFVYKLTLENGFEERGRITHINEEDELKMGYYFDQEYLVKRALYIENVLYTLSDRMVKANALDTLSELKEFKFEGSN